MSVLPLFFKTPRTRKDHIALSLKTNIILSQLKEAFLLIEFISGRLESLQSNSETQLPLIGKAQLQVDFLEERVIDLEELTDKLRGNGTHD